MSGFHCAQRRVSAGLVLALRGATFRPARFWPLAAAAASVAFHLAGPVTHPAIPDAPSGGFPAFEMPAVPEPPRLKVSVTGYSSTPDQTDETPFLTAANTRVRPGIVALSRDLLREYTAGAPFGFGDRVEVVGVGKFLVEDTMASRFHKRVDIWFATRGEAQRWGKRRHVLRAVPAATPDDLVWGPPPAPVDLPPGALFQPALSE